MREPLGAPTHGAAQAARERALGLPVRPRPQRRRAPPVPRSAARARLHEIPKETNLSNQEVIKMHRGGVPPSRCASAAARERDSTRPRSSLSNASTACDALGVEAVLFAAVLCLERRVAKHSCSRSDMDSLLRGAGCA